MHSIVLSLYIICVCVLIALGTVLFGSLSIRVMYSSLNRLGIMFAHWLEKYSLSYAGSEKV